MLATSLVNGIIKRGGTAEIKVRDLRPNPVNPDAKDYEVCGELNGYDVHAYLQPKWDDPEDSKRQSCGSFTVKRISERGSYDPYSDYNPHNLTFLDKVKSLDWACPKPKATT